MHIEETFSEHSKKTDNARLWMDGHAAQALETSVGASTVENRCVLDNESHAGVCCADSAGAEKEENKKSVTVRGSGDDLLFLKNRAAFVSLVFLFCCFWQSFPINVLLKS